MEHIFDGERMSEKKFVVVDGEGRREMKGNGAGMWPYHVICINHKGRIHLPNRMNTMYNHKKYA